MNKTRCLDLGCGDKPAFAPGSVQVGLDTDLGALQNGRRKYPEAHFVCGDGEHLPFRDRVFDHVISQVALPLMNLNAAIPEISRVLTPSGRVRLNLHHFGFAWRDLLRRIRSGHPRAAIGGFWAIANGLIFHFFGRTLRLPFTRHGYESYQTYSAMKRLLRKEGIAGRTYDIYVIVAEKQERES